MKSHPQFDFKGAVSLKQALMVGVAAVCVSGPAAAQDVVDGLQDGTIGYVMTEKFWSIYKGDVETDCPNGYNPGPREQFKILYPEDEGERTVLGTRLEREAEVWFPGTTEEPFPYYESQGTVARGLNLDGEVSEDDYTSPDGETGIDNEFNRVFRCVAGYGTPDAYMTFFENRVMHDDNYGRVLVELTGVDSLENDDDVTVTTYRGLDSLLLDAAGKEYLPYSTQRVDVRWGDEFIQTFKGEIADGVLTTEPADLRIPWPVAFSTSGVHVVKGLRFKLDLTTEDAKGLMAGYTDVEAWYRQSNAGWSTHHQSYGQLAQPSVYRAMMREADGYPDPETGKNTAISSAIEVEFKQAYIVHLPQRTAADQSGNQDVAQSVTD